MSNLWIHSFKDHVFGVVSKKKRKSSPDLRSFRYSPVLSSKCSLVFCYTFRSMVHFELIFMKDEKSASRSSFKNFLFIFTVVPALFVEKIVSPLNRLSFFVKDQLTIFVSVYFWFFLLTLSQMLKKCVRWGKGLHGNFCTYNFAVNLKHFKSLYQKSYSLQTSLNIW